MPIPEPDPLGPTLLPLGSEAAPAHSGLHTGALVTSVSRQDPRATAGSRSDRPREKMEVGRAGSEGHASLALLPLSTGWPEPGAGGPGVPGSRHPGAPARVGGWMAQPPVSGTDSLPALHLPVPTALLFKVRLREEKKTHRQVWLGGPGTGKVRDIYLTGSRLLPFSSLSPGPIGVRLRDI